MWCWRHRGAGRGTLGPGYFRAALNVVPRGPKVPPGGVRRTQRGAHKLRCTCSGAYSGGGHIYDIAGHIAGRT